MPVKKATHTIVGSKSPTGRAPSKPIIQNMPVEPKRLVKSGPDDLLAPEKLIKISDVIAKSKEITVVKTDDQLRTVDFVDGLLADMIKEIESDIKERKSAAAKEHKRICKYENDNVNPLEAERKRISTMVSACLMDRRRVAEEEARRLTIQAANDAREQAERDRETRIEVLVAEGKDDEVAELLDSDLVVENTRAVKVESVAPTGLGMHAVSRWVGEVYDLRMLLQAVLDGKVAMGTVDQPGVVMVNQPYLNKLAGLEKSTMMIPGVTAKDVGGTSR